MILATGKYRHLRGRRGFSLIEIILVIALIALAASMIVANVTALADRGSERTADEQLKSAIQTARLEAARLGSSSRLQFNEDKGDLEIWINGTNQAQFELGAAFKKPATGAVRFFLVSSTRGMEAFQEPSRSRIEQAYIEFSPDHSSTPFVAELDYGTGSPTRMVFDPFSGLIRKGGQ